MKYFWFHDCDCVSVAKNSSKKFNTRMPLNIYFKTIPPTHQQGNGILLPTTILFLYVKIFTERGVQVLMVRPGLYIDCCRIMWGIQYKGSLKHLILEFFPPPFFSVKTADFNSMPFCFLIKKKKRKAMREVTKFFMLQLWPFFLQNALFLSSKCLFW